MSELDDHQLLAEFARENSEAAFTALAQRHVNLVYSVALRSVGSTHAAQEITQAVFIILARKAKNLSSKIILSGWLYQTTRLTAVNFLRGEIRRQQREQEVYMLSTLNETNADAWPQIAPLLDDALGKLGEADRNAIVLRFFENKNLREVGAALGASEDAAKMRVNRALEKLRKFFTKRGVSLTTAIIAGAVSANSVHAAPLGLAMTVTAAAAKGAAVSGSTLTLIKGALKIMAWTKAKMAIVVGASVLLAAGTATVVIEKAAASPSAPKLPKLSATDLSWADDPRCWEVDSRVLEQIPAGVFIFRPTRFTSGGGVSSGQRFLERNDSVRDLVGTAFGSPYTRTIFPAGLPRERFDAMVTVPIRSHELLQEELNKRFSLTAHREKREMDVLLLKVKNPSPPGFKLHKGDDKFSFWSGGNGKITIKNQQPNGFFNNIETTIGQPVLNRTGLTGHYDIQLQWKSKPGESDKDAFKRALLEQLGLELVPSREPIEMLVVEKAN